MHEFLAYVGVFFTGVILGYAFRGREHAAIATAVADAQALRDRASHFVGGIGASKK